MAPKSQKTKANQKMGKKATEQLEISLRKKIKDFVVSLGHDAEDIGEEIKKTSKVLAKRLNRKFKNAKEQVEETVKKAKKDIGKKAKSKRSKTDKNLEKASKELKKLAKKAVSVTNVDVLPTIQKEDSNVRKASAPRKRASTTATAKPAAKTTATRKTNAQSTAKAKTTRTAKTPAKATNPADAHPEIPKTRGRKAFNSAPKSDPKPHNTDAVLEAGPANKYKRG
ncbi:hypothetical protein [Pelobium manganitolerans]|uniref:hypothetical protein n=1 Tax=Pelobium manganitolerans TaxID=1842495 RepID=UPI003FA3C088